MRGLINGIGGTVLDIYQQPCGDTMTPTQLRTTIAKLCINNTELGRFLGHRDGREVRRWLAGDVPVPVPVAKLLRLMVKLGLGPDDVP